MIYDSNFIKTVNFIITELEGSYSDNKEDKGGETLFGITRKYDKDAFKLIKYNLHKYKILADDMITFIKKPESLTLTLDDFSHYNFIYTLILVSYYEYYIDIDYYLNLPFKVKEISNFYKLIGMVFDFYFNSKANAIILLQKMINRYGDKKIIIDGSLGPKTSNAFLKTINVNNFNDFYNEYVKRRYNFYENIVLRNPKFKIFKQGWINRVRKLEKFLEDNFDG